MASELIVAGFDDGHTAFLVRAALARLQGKLSLRGHDLAVFTRNEGCELILQQVINLGDEAETHETFWNTLANLLVAADCSTEKDEEAASAKLAAIGIDTTFRRCVAEHILPGTAAILMLVNAPAIRDEVLGLLHGFQGKVARVPLKVDERETWGRAFLARGGSE